ncbi:MAG: MBL fold metallo-hydrolase [Oscillospiraceae bacterium]|nr:MBL fold metallo-hydrolase [Oscillospiraceae bacterium]
MEQITKNVYAETKIRGCNPGIVFTEEGSVFIDTAQWISSLLEHREFAKKKGPIKYLINTEFHIDHIFGNHWFAGECPVIGHERLSDDFWTVAGDVPCYQYSLEIIRRQDAASLHLMPAEKDYIVNKPTITFSERMELDVGNTRFNLYHTPGHSDSQIAVHIPGENVLFVGDTLFAECQMWLHSANIPQLLETLDFLESLNAEWIVPGHGPVVKNDYIAVQRAFIYEWIAAVAEKVIKGWTLEECIAGISFADRYPVDIGQGEMMEYIQHTNVVKCYNYLTKSRQKG